MADVEVISCEPVLRRIQAEFAGGVAITYVLAGLAREIADPHEMLLRVEVGHRVRRTRPA